MYLKKYAASAQFGAINRCYDGHVPSSWEDKKCSKVKNNFCNKTESVFLSVNRTLMWYVWVEKSGGPTACWWLSSWGIWAQQRGPERSLSAPLERSLFTQMVARLSVAPPPLPPLSGSSPRSPSGTAFHRNHECDVLSRLNNEESTGALRLTEIAAFLSWLTSASDALVSVEVITLLSPWRKKSGVILLKCTDTGMRAICSFSSYPPQLEWCSLLEDKTTTHHSECHIGFLCRTAFNTGVLRVLEGQGQKFGLCWSTSAQKWLFIYN